ncbi:MAG: FmdB family transcriptional regulator [Omnitrophica bacterium RIFCSPLOWO2_01_FULL_45_10]|nr:MAG: FmdB family transcriptional regulator [Omnitrophica bacterium RIFCSPLOWO2_01_FULL_45_10]
MPTYEYECEECSKRFEKFQSMTAKPLKACPECGGSVTRLIGKGSGIIFKGTGFYHTDYKNKKNQAAKNICPDAKGGSCGTCPLTDKK